MEGKVIKLIEKEVRVLQRLSKLKDFPEFLENRIKEWSDLDLLTPESFMIRKDAIKLIRAALLDPILNLKEPKSSATNRDYE